MAEKTKLNGIVGMKELRAGVVGVGYLGKYHAEKYKAIEGVDLVGVADLDEGAAREVAEKNSTTPYGSYEELFGKVDLVSIAASTSAHHKIALDFIEGGVHVLIEKPITVTVDEAAELVERASKKGVIIQVGHLERFNPAVVALKERIKRPVFIEAHRLSPFPNRSTDVDVVLDVMIHDIDIILNLVDSEVIGVDAVGIPVITNMVDKANARIKFSNGCVADITASRVDKESVRRTSLYEAHGFMTIDYGAQKISISKRGGAEESGGSGEGPFVMTEEIDMERKDTLMEETRSFVGAVRGEHECKIDGRDGMRALEVAGMVQRAVAASMAACR